MTNPCINCITLPICKAEVNDTIFVYTFLSKKCSLLENYCTEDDVTKSVKESVEQSTRRLNIVFDFFKSSPIRIVPKGVHSNVQSMC